MKRILIIAADSLVADFYHQGLQSLGFHTQVAHTIDAGIVAAWELQPELVLIDPVFPEAVADPVGKIRAGGRLTVTPFVAISHLPESTSAALKRAGVNQVVTRSGFACEQVLAAIQECFAANGPGGDLGSLIPSSSWRAAAIQRVFQSIASLRLIAHSLVKSGYSAEALQTLYFGTHVLAECVELACMPAHHRMTASLEELVICIRENPTNLNASTVRTLTQGIDFLEMLFMPNNLDRVTDPSISQILAVDDDQNFLNVIKDTMEASGLYTTGVSDSEVAYQMARTGPYNLVFLDVAMPGMNGFDLCTKLRELPGYQTVPIIFITGMATFPNQVQAKLRGGNDFIAKPFHVAEFGLKALIWIFKEQLGLV